MSRQINAVDVSVRGVRGAILVTLTLLLTSCERATEHVLDRMTRSSYLAASKTDVAFPIMQSSGEFAILLASLQSGAVRILNIPGSHLLSPYLSPDGARLVLVRRPRGKDLSELISCEFPLLASACRSILQRDGNITAPVQLDADKYLYVFSPQSKGVDGRPRYSQNDIWLVSTAGQAKKLTDLRLYQLTALGVDRDSVFFSASGPPRDKPMIPASDPNSKEQSDIFKLPFRSDSIDIPSEVIKPQFVGPGKAIKPAVAKDSFIVAYLRSKNLGTYRYDLVVRDMRTETERVFQSTGIGLSTSIVVGDAVYISAVFGSEYWIYIVEPNRDEMRRLLVIKDSSIPAAERLTLTIR